MLGLRFCARAFSSCGKWGPLFIAVRGPLSIAASLVAEHRLQTRRLSSCGARALLLCGMWDLPRPGLKPVSPALAGRFSTTAPPGKPSTFFCKYILFSFRTAWQKLPQSLSFNKFHCGSPGQAYWINISSCEVQDPRLGRLLQWKSSSNQPNSSGEESQRKFWNNTFLKNERWV